MKKKNQIISVRSTLGKDRAPRKREKLPPFRDLQPKDRGMSALKAALVLLPIVILVIVAIVLVIVYRQLSEHAGEAQPSAVQSRITESDIEDDDRLLILVSPKKPLPTDYELKLADFQSFKVDESVAGDLTEMLADSKKDGVALMLSGGYVSVQDQNELYEDEVRRLMAREGQSRARAAEEAELTVPMGGHTDEQTGLSVRFCSGDSIDFSSSEEYTWLLNNSYKYGFILRYPENKQRFTDRTPDPTLFRYVGRKNALKLRTLNMCLDEYIIYLNYR